MTACSAEMAGTGVPAVGAVSGTAPLYRALGWELAGGHYQAEVPARSLGALLPPDPRRTARKRPGRPGSAGPAR